MSRNKRKWRAERVDQNGWLMLEPREVEDAYGEFDVGCLHLEAGENHKAKRNMRRVLETAPTHIDALHHLAIILDYEGNEEEARELWERAVAAGRDAFPKVFEDGHRLEWVFLENRPFLRALHGLGTFILNHGGGVDKALDIYEKIISYNPTDNQGIREMLVELYFRKGDVDRCIELCERYPGDMLAGIAYGYPLALFKKGEKKKATEELKKVIEDLPKVAQELLKEEHEEPETDMPGYVTAGGWDQAYEYWIGFGEHWGEEELEWLRRCG